MNKVPTAAAAGARKRLVEAGGQMSQDLGLGRIVGQILVHLYLHQGERSLDEIGEELGLSKAAVSIAARQLEGMGLLRRSWRPGDRRNYYRTADNIAAALQQGLLRFVSQKMQAIGSELDHVHALLAEEADGAKTDPETQFLCQRVKRAKLLRERAEKLLRNPLLKMFLKA
jgi:DNA-binding transcriptional regulator GbsR (MarR family)